MPSAIADTGPILHLHEIGRLDCLRVFEHLVISDMVEQELRTLHLILSDLNVAVTVESVASEEWNSVVGQVGKPIIHPADAQVYVLAQSRKFQEPVLTDDLELRHHLENAGATVVGTVGILVRAYSSEWLARADLESAVELLFTASTLHLSRAFRAYIVELLTDLLERD